MILLLGICKKYGYSLLDVNVVVVVVAVVVVGVAVVVVGVVALLLLLDKGRDINDR